MVDNKKKILVVGGYGYVGQTVASVLAYLFPKQVIVAAEVAKRLFQSSFPAGVFHIEQLFEPSEFITAICEQDSDLTLIIEN